MNYSKKDIIVGFIIILILGLLTIYYFKYYKKETNKLNLNTTPASIEYKKEFNDKFKYQITYDENAIELKDVSGGNSRGLATDTEILADLESPQTGHNYEAWAQKTNGEIVLLGRLNEVKGGWLINYNKSNLKGFNKLIISRESNSDQIIETKILEGSFK